MGCFKKALLVSTIFISAAFMSVYLMYFNHGSSEDILARNAQKALHGEHTPVEEDYDYDDDDPLSKVSKIMWNRFIKENNLVSIGELYSTCEESEDRIMLGRTVLLPDEEMGGVKSRTYLNVTWDQDVEYGEMSIDVKYNGKGLYSNHFDLCGMEKDIPDQQRFISCPVRKGLKFYKKDMKIPNYLPKGHYYTKAWLTDQDKKIILCGFADFTL